MSEDFQTAVALILVYFLLYLWAKRTDLGIKKVDEAKELRERTNQLRNDESTDLTGNFKYQKKPQETVLIVEYRNEKERMWREATEKDIMILTSRKLI